MRPENNISTLMKILSKLQPNCFVSQDCEKKQKKILSTWTHHGIVYVRVNNDTRPQKITEVSDLPA